MSETIRLRLPLAVKSRTYARRSSATAPLPATSLQIAVARACLWRQWLDTGRYPHIHALATAVDSDPAYVARVLNLALLAPSLVTAILAGGPLAAVPLSRVPKALPLAWPAQVALFAQLLATQARPPDVVSHRATPP
ncbi:MAG: hypothetical protein BWY76_01252 [bacterium ADurb.Bin429]|nr:MAG: hypothetical protein BWY76_01252 [bacterium ADurb.Bin429]